MPKESVESPSAEYALPAPFPAGFFLRSIEFYSSKNGAACGVAIGGLKEAASPEYGATLEEAASSAVLTRVGLGSARRRKLTAREKNEFVEPLVRSCKQVLRAACGD